MILDESSIPKLLWQNAQSAGQCVSKHAVPAGVHGFTKPERSYTGARVIIASSLGALNHADMLPRWFINDTMNTGDWRLKGADVRPFGTASRKASPLAIVEAIRSWPFLTSDILRSGQP